MNKQRLKCVIWDEIREKSSGLLLLFSAFLFGMVINCLYGCSLEPFWYVVVLTFAVALCYYGFSFARAWHRARLRERLLKSDLSEWDDLLPTRSLAERDYRETVRWLTEQSRALTEEYERTQKEASDYYTVWVHQIKTPISVMRMHLAADDTEEHRALNAELFRIENYVDMALQYIRLDSQTNDLVIQEYALDSLLREVFRKYATQFIAYKVKLVYDGTDTVIVTDKKWFCCMLEQIISNAVKYSQGGTVSVTVTEEGLLTVSDTGIGIAAEDLPRIFEKGYTGINGRLSNKSSGLGLYLCRKAGEKLCIPVTAKSEPGKGSTFTLHINQN